MGAGTSYVAVGVGAGIYYVRVRAANAFGQSAGSNEVVLIVGGSTPSPTFVTGRWVGVAPDGIVLDLPTDSPCGFEWDLTLDLTQSGTAVTGTVTTRIRKTRGPQCDDTDPIGQVSIGSVINGTVGSGTISFRVHGGFADKIDIDFSGKFTATRMAGTLGRLGLVGSSFAVNRQ